MLGLGFVLVFPGTVFASGKSKGFLVRVKLESAVPDGDGHGHGHGHGGRLVGSDVAINTCKISGYPRLVGADVQVSCTTDALVDISRPRSSYMYALGFGGVAHDLSRKSGPTMLSAPTVANETERDTPSSKLVIRGDDASVLEVWVTW